MSNWSDQLDPGVQTEMDDYERQKYSLSEEELDKVMPKVIKFYNKHPEGKDVFRTESGACIFLIQTPEVQKNKEGKITNKPKKVNSEYGINFLWICKFRFFGETDLLSVFGTEEQWRETGLFNKKPFIYGMLKYQYKKRGEDSKIKPVKLDIFLKKMGVDELEDLHVDDYKVFHNTNIWQVIN